jgi:hypothetical protein
MSIVFLIIVINTTLFFIYNHGVHPQSLKTIHIGRLQRHAQSNIYGLCKWVSGARLSNANMCACNQQRVGISKTPCSPQNDLWKAQLSGPQKSSRKKTCILDQWEVDTSVSRTVLSRRVRVRGRFICRIMSFKESLIRLIRFLQTWPHPNCCVCLANLKLRRLAAHRLT